MKGYKRKLEKKLIENFMKTFYEKIGYYPKVIIPGSNVINDEGLKILTLNELQEYFDPFLPKMRNNHSMNLFSKCRKRKLVEVRFIFYYIARSMKYTLTEIGQYAGRDHTTIMHGLQMFVTLYKQDDIFKSIYHEIINFIKKDEYEPSAMGDID